MNCYTIVNLDLEEATQLDMQFVEKVTQALEKGKYVVGVFLDLKKALTQLTIVFYYRRGSLYQWFQSYLTNRTHFVSYKSTNSETQKVTHGIPQGSTLGPLMFILYTNDFSRCYKLSFSILFADDITLIIEGNEYHRMIF